MENISWQLPPEALKGQLMYAGRQVPALVAIAEPLVAAIYVTAPFGYTVELAAFQADNTIKILGTQRFKGILKHALWEAEKALLQAL